jgi:hypothetical protein
MRLMDGDMPLRILCVMSDRNVVQFLLSPFLLLLVNINEIHNFVHFFCVNPNFDLLF